MNVASHGNETRIRSLVIGESEFIFCCCCCETMVFSGEEITLVAFSDWSRPSHRSQVVHLKLKPF